MILNKGFIAEVIEWDVENWQYALKYWNNLSVVNGKPLKCLELGARRGGLSLWLATIGHDVVCSDIENPKKIAQAHHAKFELKGKINYEAVNALETNYENEFDIIVFKSIIGGVSRNGQYQLQQRFIDSCYRSLKDGGTLLFAENVKASSFHQFARKRFVKHGTSWNYLDIKDIPSFFTRWKSYEYKTIGFLGTFGRTEKQRVILGKIDRLLHYFIPKNKRYIVYGKAVK